MSKMGRPTIIDDTRIAILIQSFHDGLNIQQACWQADISADAYYDRRAKDPDFADIMKRAQDFLSMNARANVTKAIKKGELKTTRWYLERKAKDEFSSRTEVTGKGGKPLIGGIEPEAKDRLDKILARKNQANANTAAAGDDRPDDSGGGGSPDQGVS